MQLLMAFRDGFKKLHFSDIVTPRSSPVMMQSVCHMLNIKHDQNTPLWVTKSQHAQSICWQALHVEVSVRYFYVS